MEKILILHGWTYSLNKWGRFLITLKKGGFDPVLLKIPGLTVRDNQIWDLNKYVDWLQRNLDDDKKGIVLMGHSNGGRIAIAFAVKYPEKVKQLILIDSAGIFHNNWPIRLKRTIFKTISFIGKKITLSDLSRKLFYKVVGESDYEMATPEMRRTMINLISYDLRPILSKIVPSTLIVWGANDKITPLSDARVMNKLIRNSKLVVIKDAGHSPFYEYPGKVAELIKENV